MTKENKYQKKESCSSVCVNSCLQNACWENIIPILELPCALLFFLCSVEAFDSAKSFLVTSSCLVYCPSCFIEEREIVECIGWLLCVAMWETECWLCEICRQWTGLNCTLYIASDVVVYFEELADFHTKHQENVGSHFQPTVQSSSLSDTEPTLIKLNIQIWTGYSF